MTMVCAYDGVVVVQGRTGWLHTDSIPDGVDPDHMIADITIEEWEGKQRERADVHTLAAELLHHHVAMHPASDCAFARRLGEALRSKR